MYIDSLTIAAAVIFFAALTVFVRFCIVKTCGLLPPEEGDKATAASEKHS